jgi:hypothetical protein
MRVLVLDGDAGVSVGASFLRAFEALGHDTHFLDNSIWLGWANHSLMGRVRLRLMKPVAVPAYNAHVLAEVARLRPDILFVMKGVGLWPGTVAAASRWVRATVVFHNDDFRNKVNATPEMAKAIPSWDLVLTPRDFAVDELYASGAKRVECLRFAYDPTLSFPPASSELDATLANSAAFVGTCMPERVAPLEALAARVPLAVFGNRWNVGPESALRDCLRPATFGSGLRVINASAGVNVAFVAKANRDQHTMRTFEIPACGGFLLAERTPVHADVFREDEEAVFFGSQEELVEKSVRYLGDPEARRRIAEAGRRRVSGRERYQDRAAQVVEWVRELVESGAAGHRASVPAWR